MDQQRAIPYDGADDAISGPTDVFPPLEDSGRTLHDETFSGESAKAKLATPFSAPTATFPTFEGNRGPLYAEPFFDEPTEVKRRRSTKRKQTLIQLLDELTSLKDDELDLDKEQDVPATQNVTERIKALPVIVDDRLQAEGAQLFNQFNKRIRQVDEQLLSFGNAVRPLGSSVGLISSAYHLRVRLQQILHLFRENAAECFPDKLKKEPVEPLKPLSSRKRSKARLAKFGHEPTRKIRLTPPLTSDLEEFPTQFLVLAKDLVSFLHFLHDIPEFTDESLNASVLSFEGDLKYWASCLEEFEGQFGFPAVKRYVNDLTREMDEHLENIRDALKLFVQDGVSTIRTAQRHTQIGLQHLSIVAVFFSGVTATTIQYTFNVHATLPQKVVNALWISSLVFSVASFINSQLAYHWRAAMYRSPRNAVPWWIIVLLTKTPLIFLVFSVIMFEAGLVTFTYTSGQGRLVSTCCTILTAITSLALLAVCLWFAAERIVFSRTKGSRWVTDVLRDARKEFMRRTGLTWVADVPTKRLKRAATWVSEKLSKASSMAYDAGTNMLGRISTTVLPPGGSSTSGDSYEDGEEYVTDGGVLPVALNSLRSVHARQLSEASAGPAKLRRTLPSHSPPVIFEDQFPVSSSSADIHPGPFGSLRPSTLLPIHPVIFEDQLLESSPADQIHAGPFSPLTSSTSPPDNNPTTALPTSLAAPSTRDRPGLGADGVIESQRLGQRENTDPLHLVLDPPRRSSTTLEHQGRDQVESTAYRPTGQSMVSSALKVLAPAQHLMEHSGPVRHMHFSPDGKWMATCGDRAVVIWKVDEPFQRHKTLVHPGYGFISHVAWSPGGKYLLTKLGCTVRVWVPDSGDLLNIIHLSYPANAMMWLPSGRAFASVEHDHVYILDLQGAKLDTHTFDGMRIHAAAFTPDEQRMLLLGSLISPNRNFSPGGLHDEKHFLVYNLADKKVENDSARLKHVRDVSICRNGSLALVSYEEAPPEVWAIGASASQCQLSLLNTYLKTSPGRSAGPSYFCGVKDQFVICAGKKGTVDIWDQESGILLHALQDADIMYGDSGDLTCISWNSHASGQFMFATAAHDGRVRIWTAPAPPEVAYPWTEGSEQLGRPDGLDGVGTSSET